MAGSILILAALSGILFFIPALALSRLADQEIRLNALFTFWVRPA